MPLEVQRPRKNRVTPFGSLERSSARGAIMGNRGDLHDRAGEIVRPWRNKAWIACTLVGQNGYRVPFDKPGSYAPLFAIDEAIMLAAGHRPCAQCRRDAFDRFKAAWARANGEASGKAVSAVALDSALHIGRLNDAGEQRTSRAQAGDLPSGTVVATSAPDEPNGRTAWLLWGGHMHPWSHRGYGRPELVPTTRAVEVLTPEPIVAVLRAGYVPEVASGDFFHP